MRGRSPGSGSDVPARTVPLRDYGVIGDRTTAALVSADGSVDWWCPDRFDAPSAFARLLDPDGGFFHLGPDAVASRHMEYVAHTNVLRTAWTTREGALVVTDAMPVDGNGAPPGDVSRILRVAECVRGRVPVRVTCAPRPDYARVTPRASAIPGGVRFESDVGTLSLSATMPLTHATESGVAEGRLVLEAGDAMAMRLTARPPEADAHEEGPVTVRAAHRALAETRAYWESWVEPCRHEGGFREHVIRSALVLKLLDYAHTGALVAAPTTSLPEHPAGERNWDYRYAWLRDTALAVPALHQTGHTEDAVRLAHWTGRLLEGGDARDLRVLYRVDGSMDVEERELPHLRGYAGSAPVRVGNAAESQRQLDVYGELVDVLHACRKLGSHEEEVEWRHVRELIDHVRRTWREPDRGMWEMRAAPRHFVVSKVFSWVALDRGVRAIEELDLEGPADAWRDARDAVREEVLARGFDTERETFVMAYDEPALDAGTLLIPLMGFLPARDARVRGTTDAIMRDLTVNGLVRRYADVDDGIDGPEGTFGICSCWLAEVLARQDRVDEASQVLTRLLSHAGPTGLLSEQVDARTGALLGNHPQALTHIGVINAASAIRRAEAARDEAGARDDATPPGGRERGASRPASTTRSR